MNGDTYFLRLAVAYRIVRTQGLWQLVPCSFRSRRQLRAAIADLLGALELVVIFVTSPLWWPFWCFYQYVVWAWLAAAQVSHERLVKTAAFWEDARKGGAE